MIDSLYKRISETEDDGIMRLDSFILFLELNIWLYYVGVPIWLYTDCINVSLFQNLRQNLKTKVNSLFLGFEISPSIRSTYNN